MNFYTPKHFAIHEVVDEKTFAKFGNLALQFLDPKLLITADKIRERYNSPIYINTYLLKVDSFPRFNYRGYRPRSCTVGAEYSQHRHGRALDLTVVNVDAETIRQDILADPFHDDFKYITSIEASVSWLHFDVRNRDKNIHGILVTQP